MIGWLAVSLGFLGLGVTAWRRWRWEYALTPLVLAITSGYWALGGSSYHLLPDNQEGYEPEQPIAFSHRLHATELEIDCFYCHSGADRSPEAGIPPVAVCMNCHAVVRTRKGETEPSSEIAKIVEIWEARDSETPRSIEWVRVHRLQDFVRFSHRTHVKNGIECGECHGAIEDMERVRQVEDLSMGWCVGCHRHEGREPPRHWKRSKATLDCSECHL
ncbi:MAG: cytochrome c3 family protein [Planctomycetes bacterium]|nr:cytochrome c3 family protein [Planctomycetota bacterium]